MLNKRGFLPENVLRLTSTASTPVTKKQVGDAITSWAREKLAAAPGHLYLFLVDHGTQTGFVLDNETLSPDDLKGYLDTLEGDGAVAAAVADYRRFVLVGTCYSGGFVDRVSKAGRVVISSATADEQSIAGFSIYNSATGTTVTGGEYFIDNLINFLGRGDSFKAAFATSRDMVALRDPRQVPLGAHADAYDTLAQHPLLDDAGYGKGSYLLDRTGQGDFLSGQALGTGIRVLGNPTDITAVTETIILPATDTSTVPLWLKVGDDSRVARAWAEIRTPISSVTTSVTGQVIPRLVTLPLYYDGVQWQAGYTFPNPGTYDILYYTQDNQTGDVSPMVHGRVYRQKAAGTSPAGFALVSPPNEGTVDPQFTLFWEPAQSVNKVSYTLVVSDPKGQTVYREEGIKQPATYITAEALKDPASATGGYYCQNGDDYCFWKVQAVDSYGAVTESETRSFTVQLTNAVPAIVSGTVVDAATGAPLPGARVSTATGMVRTLENGYFLLVTGAASRLTVSADAGAPYLAASTSVSTSAGKVSRISFSLSPPAVTGVCGTSSGQAFGSAPTDNLCAGGTLSAAPSGAGPWSWSCGGSFGGSTANCRALATQGISFTPPPQKAYGDQPMRLAAVGSGSGNPVTFSVASGPGTVSGTDNATLTITGAGSIVVVASQGGNLNFAAAPDVQRTIVVAKAKLTVVADDKSRLANKPNPALSYSYRGFVNGDSAAVLSGVPQLATAATAASKAGSYPITVTAGTLASANYSFTPVDGTLTVLPTLAGDCNGDSAVSVAEVQNAINMFLGTSPVASCVDTEGRGTVSISGVQTVINRFLGL